jgi:putative membrane protein
MKYKLFLFTTFLVFWLWAAYKPVFPHDWLLENYLVFIAVPIILVTARYFKLSNISYTLITIFMCAHVVGSHYTYAEVPFGFTLQDWFGSDRNMYDRVVHFSYGFLLAYPVREIFVRIAGAKGFWSYFFPIDLVFANSAIYELIEWFAARNVPPEAGLAFLGSQGDVWDAQKDMGLAGLGAIIAMLIVFVIHLWLDKHTCKEMKESFKIPKGDKPLGEQKLKELWEAAKQEYKQ